MDGKCHAFDLLQSKPETLPPVCAVFGDESFLKRLILDALKSIHFGADDSPASEFEGSAVAWRDIADALATASLFGPASRFVVVRNADDFVSNHRSQLETYVAAPAATSTLVLDVKSWPGNTRLAKAVNADGLAVQCSAPTRQAGKKSVPDTNRIIRWMRSWADKRHGLKISDDAVAEVVELSSNNLGLTDQNFAKLALSVKPGTVVDATTAIDIVGGWRTKTTWELLDAACDGKAAEALTQLDRMLQAGEHPQAMFGAFSWSLRRFAAATRAVEKMEQHGKRVDLPGALTAAGFRKFPKGAQERARKQLLQLGRQRAGQMYHWLLDADLKMKSSHSQLDRARYVLEHLILRMARQAAPPRN